MENPENPENPKYVTSDIKTKTAQFDFKQINEEGEFEGYASRFDVEDDFGDTVKPGAFAETLRKKGITGIKMLAHHDRREIIGVWNELKEDKIGLFARGSLFGDEAKIRDRMKAGALDGLSIGFRTVTQEVTDPQTFTRDLIKLELFEISVVTFPALDSARVTDVKELPTKRDLEHLLTRDAGFSRSEAQAIINGKGFNEIVAMRDAGSDHSQQIAVWLKTAAQTIRKNHV